MSKDNDQCKYLSKNWSFFLLTYCALHSIILSMIQDNKLGEIIEKFVQELRRGALTLAVLNQLEEQKYGYELIESLAGQGLVIDQGTLYPLLRRLEEQGLLQSEWNVEGARPRRYYVLSPDGNKLLGPLTNEWFTMSDIMKKILKQSNLLGEE